MTKGMTSWQRSGAAIACVLLALGLAGCAHQTAGAPGQQGEPAAVDLRHRAHIRLELAASYLQNNQVQIALQEVQQALATDPGYADAYNLQGLIYLTLGDLAQAEASLRRAQEMLPGDPDVMHNYGWLLCQRQQYAQAHGLFERALAVPTYGARGKTFFAQGLCLQRAGRLPEAEQALMHAYEIDAANPLVGYRLASVIFERGDAKRAQFYIRRVNNGEFSGAETLWLGIKIERALQESVAMRQLGDQLTRRFPDARQTQSFARGAFHE